MRKWGPESKSFAPSAQEVSDRARTPVRSSGLESSAPHCLLSHLLSRASVPQPTLFTQLTSKVLEIYGPLIFNTEARGDNWPHIRDWINIHWIIELHILEFCLKGRTKTSVKIHNYYWFQCRKSHVYKCCTWKLNSNVSDFIPFIHSFVQTFFVYTFLKWLCHTYKVY